MASKFDHGYSVSNYFLANSAKSIKCEEVLPDYGLEELDNIYDSDENHKKEREALFDKYKESLFPKVFTLLTNGYNIVLYGFGSKRLLIRHFITQYLSQYTVIIFYGYKDDVGQRQIIAAFREALEIDKMDDDSIIESLKKLRKPIVLVIHSFDRLVIRNSKVKPLINRILTRAPTKVHLLTSVDHVNSSLIWTCREIDYLNLLWLDCPTFSSYYVEKSFAHLSTSRSSGSSKHRSAAATLMAVSNVFDNLPHNSQKIFLLILQFYQTQFASGENKVTNNRRKTTKNDEASSESDTEDEANAEESGKNTKGFEGYSFKRLYQDCMDAFYVNSEATLTAQLVEFKDHKLIRSKTGSDGSEYIELLIQPKLIPKLLQELTA